VTAPDETLQIIKPAPAERQTGLKIQFVYLFQNLLGLFFVIELLQELSVELKK
jgi:hypothetical protein